MRAHIFSRASSLGKDDENVSARMVLWLASSPGGGGHNRDRDRGLEWRGEGGDSPLFPCALAEVVPSVEHHAAADGEEGGGLEASCGQVALWWETQCQQSRPCTVCGHSRSWQSKSGI